MEPYRPNNLLDRVTSEATLAVHYEQEQRREPPPLLDELRLSEQQRQHGDGDQQPEYGGDDEPDREAELGALVVAAAGELTGRIGGEPPGGCGAHKFV